MQRDTRYSENRRPKAPNGFMPIFLNDTRPPRFARQDAGTGFRVQEGQVGTRYEMDVVAWANEQARLIRAGRFDLLDLEHIAEEIEDVGKSEQRELAHRMAVLLAHLLKWQYQPDRRGSSWVRTIKEQRKRVLLRLEETPSLSDKLKDPRWWSDVWADAVSQAISETGVDTFPDECPWAIAEVIAPDWLPV